MYKYYTDHNHKPRMQNRWETIMDEPLHGLSAVLFVLMWFCLFGLMAIVWLNS